MEQPESFCDEERERRVLGGLLVDTTLLPQVTWALTPEDWCLDTHRFIYEVIVHLAFQETTITVANVSETLQQQGLLETIGGTSYLSQLLSEQESVQTQLLDARLVHQLALRRRLEALGKKMIALAHHESDTRTALAQVETAFAVLSPEYGLRALHDLLQEYRPHLEQWQDHVGTISGVPTGFSDLDTLTGGLQPATLTVVASPPGIGKTTFLLSLLLNAVSRHKRSGGIFSLERSAQQVTHAGLERHALVINQVDEERWQHLSISLETLSHTTIWIDDTPDLSLDLLEKRAAWMVHIAKVDLLIIDSVSLMNATIGGKRYENRVQEVAELSRGLKNLARKLNVPLLVSVQMSRLIGQREAPAKRSEADREAPTPRLSDLRDGSFENDADLVLFVSRDDVLSETTSRKNLVDILVAKHRDGPLGEMTVYCSPNDYSFHDLEVSPLEQDPSEA